MNNEFLPKWIAWEVTRRCNLKCVHCRSSSNMDNREGEWTLDEAKALIDDITSNYSPVVVLSGGEPLMREDVFDIATYGTSKGLRMCIATDGTLVTDEICEKMKASGIKICSLSLDGATKETHDNFRDMDGAFEGTLNAAKLFKKHGIEFIVNSSFTKRNQSEIEATYKLAKKIGAKSWYMSMIVPTGRGEEIMNELISKEDYEKILNWHYDIERDEEKSENKMLVRPTCAPQYYRVWRQRAKQDKQGMKRRSLQFSTGGGKGCICAQSIMLIDYLGNVQPCSYFPHQTGNLRDQSFKDIWENSELFNNLRDFKKYKGKCGQCEYLNVCGGCRARADAVYHDYLAEEPFCDYIPAKMQKKEEEK